MADEKSSNPLRAVMDIRRSELPLALLMFNVGVETGQILFVCGVLLVMAVLRRVPVGMPAGSWRLVPYFIGCTAAFWTVQRVSSFV